MKLVLERTLGSVEELEHFCEEMVRLIEEKPFCMWLRGDLGSGKTTSVQRMLYKLGLDYSTPVNSPTYTYIQSYSIDKVVYAHLDLYRIQGVQALHELDITLPENCAGVFVEWPEKLQDEPLLDPTCWLEMAYVDANTRLARFYLPGF